MAPSVRQQTANSVGLVEADHSKEPYEFRVTPAPNAAAQAKQLKAEVAQLQRSVYGRGLQGGDNGVAAVWRGCRLRDVVVQPADVRRRLEQTGVSLRANAVVAGLPLEAEQYLVAVAGGAAVMATMLMVDRVTDNAAYFIAPAVATCMLTLQFHRQLQHLPPGVRSLAGVGIPAATSLATYLCRSKSHLTFATLAGAAVYAVGKFAPTAATLEATLEQRDVLLQHCRDTVDLAAALRDQPRPSSPGPAKWLGRRSPPADVAADVANVRQFLAARRALLLPRQKETVEALSACRAKLQANAAELAAIRATPKWVSAVLYTLTAAAAVVAGALFGLSMALWTIVVGVAATWLFVKNHLAGRCERRQAPVREQAATLRAQYQAGQKLRRMHAEELRRCEQDLAAASRVASRCAPAGSEGRPVKAASAAETTI